MVAGASVALMARFSASRYFDRAIAHRCTVSSLFAAPMRMLLAQPRRPEHARNDLRAVIFAQSVTPAQLAEWDERFRAPLMQLWGMTETMGPPLINPLDGERRNMSMGLPAPGYTSRLVDGNGRPVARGAIGQIVVRGEPGFSLMKGYYKNPEATAETIRDGWLWSGDNARQDEDGYYHFVDRAKDMIKRSGENVAASEVEAVIREHPGRVRLRRDRRARRDARRGDPGRRRAARRRGGKPAAAVDRGRRDRLVPRAAGRASASRSSCASGRSCRARRSARSGSTSCAQIQAEGGDAASPC